MYVCLRLRAIEWPCKADQVFFVWDCYIQLKYRDEDPEFFSTDPDPAQLKKNSGSGSDLKSK